MQLDKSDQYEEDYHLTRANSFKEVVLIHLRRLAELSCVEMRGGYYSYVKDKFGTEKEVYHEDSREKYSNGVYALAILLLPKFDKEMTKKFDDVTKYLEELRQKFLDDSSIPENEVLSEGFYLKESDKILLEEYKIAKLRLYHKMFSELSKLLARINYLEMAEGGY